MICLFFYGFWEKEAEMTHIGLQGDRSFASGGRTAR